MVSKLNVILFLFLMSASHAAAGPSPEDMDYSISRTERMDTEVRNGYRFDFIRPIKPNFDIPGGQNASWYGDELIVVRKIGSGEVVYARSLKSDNVEILSDGLSDDYLVMREYSGGSCCFWISAFRTKPSFELILMHNNDYFDMSNVINGEHTIELHRDPFIQIGGGAHPEYNPKLFDLKTGRWK